jgi:stage V sporulation protein AD
MNKHIGKQSIQYFNPPKIISAAAIVGPKEGEGPLAGFFDVIEPDALFGTESWEKAESEIVRRTVELSVEKAGLGMEDIQYILAGDLLNQGTGSTFGLRSTNVPVFGLFGACSTFGEGLVLGAALVDGGYADYTAVSASSHLCSAEKTFRFPLEFGAQRATTSAWTVTGDGCVVLSSEGGGPRITRATPGRILDMGVKDTNNMGAAMAPAAADVVSRHFMDFNTGPDDYDVIATGDLGKVGTVLFKQLMEENGYTIGDNYTDCGLEIYSEDNKEKHTGGSGCGCSAVTFAAYFYQKLKRMEIKRILFVPTGSLHSVVTMQQGETIPAIAHAVVIEA